MEDGTPHNESREQIWDELVEILIAKHGDEVSREMFDASLRRDAALVSALHRAWPLITPTDLVGDLWTVPAYLRLAASHLSREEVHALQRTDPHAWTTADLPLLDAARHRLGDPDRSRRDNRRSAAIAADREVRSFTVVGDRAQARHGFTESWRERLSRVGVGRVTVASLSINYRTPAEVMVEAEPVIRAELPGANVPTSIRSTGVPVLHGPVADLHPIVDRWLADHS